mgnify:CR=1 FL=1
MSSQSDSLTQITFVMSRIINNTNVLLSPATQQAIHNATANIGIDTVVIKNDMNPDYPFVSVSDEHDNRLYYANIFNDEIYPFE